MRSYHSDVTSYLMAASEGKCRMSGADELATEPEITIPDDEIKPGARRLLELKRKDGVAYFHQGNVTGRWSSWSGSEICFMERFMADRFSDWWYPAKQSNRTFAIIFEKMEDFMPTLFQNLTTLSGPYRKYWRQRPSGDLLNERERLRLDLEVHCRAKGANRALANTIVFMRLMYAARTEMGPFGRNETVDDSMTKACEEFKHLVNDGDRFAKIFQSSTPSARMFLCDLRDHVDKEDCAAHMVCSARNRIFMHLRGAGGFIVSCADRKFEISSKGDGSSGLYYREFVIAESYTTEQSQETGVTVTTSVSFGPEFSFSAGLEISRSQTYGWGVTTEENPTEWKRIKEKSFLDGLTESRASLGRLILMMNWYLGGLDEWVCTSQAVEYGSLMKENRMEWETLRYFEALKMDSPFTKGELSSVLLEDCSDMKKTPFHDLDGSGQYKRVRPGIRKKLLGFNAADCRSCLNMTDEERFSEIL